MSAAVRKKAGGAWLLFWLVFLIGVTLLFMVNMEGIKGTLSETKVLDKLFKNGKAGSEEDPAGDLERLILELANAPADGSTAEQAVPLGGTAQLEELERSGVFAQTGGTGQDQSQPALGKTVERSVYLMKVDNTGAILWTTVKRDLPVSDSPLLDTLEALIKGPSSAEEKQGLMSLIPKNVKVQNVVVRGSTAYVSFSEDFLFNTFGVEGYAGQRRQIVLTATEFSNVKDVQILIDGKPVEYLGEGVWIGSPVSRNML